MVKYNQKSLMEKKSFFGIKQSQSKEANRGGKKGSTADTYSRLVKIKLHVC